MKSIKIKYLLADFPICLFNKEKDEVLIPQWLFDDRKEHLILLTLAPAKKKFVKSLWISLRGMEHPKM